LFLILSISIEFSKLNKVDKTPYYLIAYLQSLTETN